MTAHGPLTFSDEAWAVVQKATAQHDPFGLPDDLDRMLRNVAIMSGLAASFGGSGEMGNRLYLIRYTAVGGTVHIDAIEETDHDR